MRARRFLPNRIDFYVLREVAGPFLGGVVFFLFVFLMFQALRLAEFFIVHGVSGGTLGKMAMLMALSFLPMVLPVAFLIAVLVGFGRLSSDSELVAMKASGISLARLSVPVASLALVVCVVSLFLNMEWVPWGERNFKSMLIRVGNTKVVSSIKEGTFTSGFFDLLIFADKVDPKTNRLKHVFIYDERDAKNPVTVVAQSGEIVTVKAPGQDPGLGVSALLQLYDGSIHRNDQSGDTYQKVDFGTYKLYLKNDEGSGDPLVKPQMIPYRDLMDKIAHWAPNTYEGTEFRGEFWRRIGVAVTPLIFVFLGMGFGTVRTRAVRAGAALVAFVVLAVYWSLLTFMTIQMMHGRLPPLIAMMAPNLVMAIAGTASFRRSSW